MNSPKQQTRFPGGWPAWLRKRVEQPDCAGGSHPGLLGLAYWLRRYEEPRNAFRWLKDAAQRCDRTPDDEELRRMVGWAGTMDGQPGDHPRRAPINLEAMHDIIVSGVSRDDLREMSPQRCWDTMRGRNTARILEAWAAYAGDPDPWVCHGANDQPMTRRLSAMRAWAHSHAQIVPSPMAAPHGRTREGHLSEHSLEATGPRLFLIAEFDFVPANAQRKPTIWKPLIEACAQRGRSILDMNASIIAHLSKTVPLWMVVFSGNKSLQGWFPCRGADERLLGQWFHGTAAALGACSSTWGRSQFVRMPDGSRDDGARQTVEYCNPAILAAPNAFNAVS
jgi:hypothetical protein